MHPVSSIALVLDVFLSGSGWAAEEGIEVAKIQAAIRDVIETRQLPADKSKPPAADPSGMGVLAKP